MSYSLFLLVVGGVVVALATFFDKEPIDRWKTKNFLGSVVLIIAGAWSACDQQKADFELTQKNDEILKLSRQLTTQQTTEIRDRSGIHTPPNRALGVGNRVSNGANCASNICWVTLGEGANCRPVPHFEVLVQMGAAEVRALAMTRTK